MKMIEKVARAIANGKYDHPDTEPDDRRTYRDLAIDALDELRKPTPRMIHAANNFMNMPFNHPIGEALIKHIVNVAINEGADE